MGKYASREGSKADLEAKIVRGLNSGVSAWMMLAAQLAQGFAPVDTGRLARSIHEDPDGPQEISWLIFSGLIGTNVEYARAHELGSGIHALDPSERQLIIIEAGFWTGKSSKKALAFHWPGGPQPHPAYDADTDMYLFRRIYHPGVSPANQGEGYLRKGAHQSAEQGKRLVALAVTAELRR